MLPCVLKRYRSETESDVESSGSEMPDVRTVLEQYDSAAAADAESSVTELSDEEGEEECDCMDTGIEVCPSGRIFPLF